MHGPLAPPPFDLDGLNLLRLIARHGSFAAAARASGRVPSAVTYAIRKLESSLDVSLFERRRNSAELTPAGREMLAAAERLLAASEEMAARVRAVGGGWERELRIGVDAAIAFERLAPLIADFDRLTAPTRLRLDHHVLTGAWDALRDGRVDLAIGLPAMRLAPRTEETSDAGADPLRSRPLGSLRFAFCVAPGHPLAAHSGGPPVPAKTLRAHRMIVLADPRREAGRGDLGVLAEQPTITVATLEQKIAAQIAGLGAGYLPESFARAPIAAGRLVALSLAEPRADLPLAYAWRTGAGQARDWWLARLATRRVRDALLEGPEAS